MLEFSAIICPYCWEHVEVPLETEPGNHEFIEDCPVCCQAILMRVTIGLDGELQHVESVRENE
jgi:Cysteine-rich CPXCG|nr:CPXCG motif-containing cysteine-rich protein [Gammaproteobacteria bacterium]